MIDRVAEELGRTALEVPVGFKWFVSGLLDGERRVRRRGVRRRVVPRARTAAVWTTDKDGIILALLASEILAVTGRTPRQHYGDLVERHGDPAYARIDAPANRDQKAKLARLSPDDVTADRRWPASRSPRSSRGARQRRADRRPEGDARSRPGSRRGRRGTEDVYKIYAESFRAPNTWPRSRPRRRTSWTPPSPDQTPALQRRGRQVAGGPSGEQYTGPLLTSLGR